MTSESTGVVAFYDAGRNFGFIVPTGVDADDRNRHCFVSGHAVRRAGLTTLLKGQRVRFRIEESLRPSRKSEAQDIKILLDDAA
jgi:cold shock CspA family protein